MSEQASSSPPSSRTVPSRRARLGVLAISIAASLALAEGGASLVHRRAFPYLNIYEKDETFGVRLAANTETRVRTRTGRVTDVRTNALGFRGADWAPAATDTRPRVLLLGDSQVFGYNVDESVSFGSRLAEGGRFTVLNAAVPSYGPPDYVRMLETLGPEQRPRFVVFVANAANDWFEPVPNVRRSSAADGWLTRPEMAPGRWFPFRDWAMSRSHLVFGVRQVASFVSSEPAAQTAQTALRLKRDLKMLRRGKRADGSGDRSTITKSLRGAVSACAGIGCQVIAVALPCDVQVSAAEIEKYRAPAVDLSDTEAILEDFIADARDLGVPAVNLLAPLRAAEPGAFLDDDYHLSAKGHQAVADALLPSLRLPEASLSPESP